MCYFNYDNDRYSPNDENGNPFILIANFFLILDFVNPVRMDC